MTIDARCVVCKHTDRRRAIELMWNGGMPATVISDVLGGSPSQSTILKHLKEHTDGEGNSRTIEVEPELPVRQRVLNLQRMQLDEIERRVKLAKTKADLMNAEHKDDPTWEPVDWAYFHDILGKDMQSAIGSILKTQGLSDKRDKAQGDLKLGLFEAMVGAGLAPPSLVGGVIPQIGPGDGDD